MDDAGSSAPPWWLCTTVLTGGAGVCRMCHGPARSVVPVVRGRDTARMSRGATGAVCFCCAAAARATGFPPAPVAAISLCRIPGPLYGVLRDYKDAPSADARRHFAAQLADVVKSFLAGHLSCLERAAGSPIDLAVPVPSTSRPGPSPLALLQDAGLPVAVADLLRRGPGLMGHLRAHRDGFAPSEQAGSVVARLANKSVLLVDDTFVSGTRAQSAAAALRRAGARRVVVLVVGRVVRPEVSATHAAYWGRAAALPYDPLFCCLPGCDTRGGAECNGGGPGGERRHSPMWSAGTLPSRPAW